MQKLSKRSERRQFTEIRSDLIYKYLPKFKFFTDGYGIFALNISGDITHIRRSGGLAKPGLSDFMMKQEIRVTDASIAIEAVKLMKDITSAPNSIRMLKANTDNYRIFNKSYYRRISGDDSDWRYHATKESDLWTVQMEFIGPPETCIMLPATWNILTDHIGRIKEVRQQYRDISVPEYWITPDDTMQYR
jgi:hypothetical protein